MTAQEAAVIIRSTLARERTMRERVFAHKPDTLTAKLAEIDRASAALDTLLAATQWQPVTNLDYSDPAADPDCWQYTLYVNGDCIGLVDREDEDNWREVTLPADLRLCRRVSAPASTETARPTLFDEVQP
jgi:hypothetical protein